MLMGDTLYVARIKRHHQTFELVIDPEQALLALQGKIPPAEALLDETVFTDAEKGLRASDTLLEDAFGTQDVKRIAELIFQYGDVQLTAEQRKRLREQLFQQVVSEIARMAIDPRSHLPHPPQRIQLALEEAKWHVDDRVSLERNVEAAVKALRPILPIRLSMLRYRIRIPAMHIGRAYAIVRKHASILQEDYSPEGDWIVTVEIPGGLRDELMDAVNAATQGTAIFEETE